MHTEKITYNGVLLQKQDLEFPTACQSQESNERKQTGQQTSILILDDDEHFRDIVHQIFTTQGYEVWHAKCADDAFAYLHLQPPDLAIVDYRLPGMDGISWIAKSRRNGFSFPVVLCTGAGIDQKTFNFLRNILKVSLVLQKPIVPELFLHSIEAILPSHMIPTNAKSCVDNPVLSSMVPEPLNTPSSLECDKENASPSSVMQNGQPDAQELSPEEKVKLERCIATQNAITNARYKFANELPEIWNAFADIISRGRANADSGLWQEAAATAHKLKGSTGSYGFSKLSQLCDRLENFLICLDPSCATEQEILWAEINRWVIEGTNLSRRIKDEQTTVDFTNQIRLSILAVVPEESQSIGMLNNLVATNRWVFVEYTNSIFGAQLKCNDSKFDAIIIDLALDARDDKFELIKEIRSIPGCMNIPLVFICHKEYTQAQLTYAGGIAFTSYPVTANALNECLRTIVTESESRKAKILCIDDDKSLTLFIESILSDEGYSVHSLNEPVITLEEVESFHPDLILLDVLMPGLSGFDVCRMLKSHESSSTTPVIFLTAKCDARSRSCAFQAGAEDFLAKPVVREELLARIRAHLPQNQLDYESKQPGLINVQHFNRVANRILSLSKESCQTSAILVVSIQETGQLNLLHGPFACSQVENTIANLLARRFRPQDIRTQLQEDRFAICLPGVIGSEAQEIAKSLEQELSNVWFANNHGETFQPRIDVRSIEAGKNSIPLVELIELCVEQMRQEIC